MDTVFSGVKALHGPNGKGYSPMKLATGFFGACREGLRTIGSLHDDILPVPYQIELAAVAPHT